MEIDDENVEKSHLPIPIEKIEKKYYTVTEVAEQLDVNASQLRYWETEFEELAPKKNKNGKRLYTQKDIELLEKILYLVKDKRYTLEGARIALEKNSIAVEYEMKTKAFLLKLRKFLVAFRDNLE